ncbi:MAG TPA: hypothetical protein VGI10_30805 [Polyangiaceae bacterium]
MSVRALAGIALAATVLSRGIAPAIPGLSVGLEHFILITDRGSALLSQLAAAGGIAATCQLAVSALRTRHLQLGLRLIGLPASAIVVALVMAAWARPLQAELCRALALAGIATATTAAVSALADASRRASALVLALASGSALLHLAAREFALRAVEVMSPTAFHWSSALATVAVLVDVAALTLTGLYLSRKNPLMLALGAASVLAVSLTLAILARHGTAPGAGAFSVLTLRTLAQLSRAPLPMLPELLRFTILLCTPLLAILALSQRAPRARSGTVMALCLLSLGSPDMPLPALWLVLAALLCPSFEPGWDTVPHPQA